MSTETDLIALVRSYFGAIENGAPGESLQFFAEDVVQEEFPNRLVPDGATRDLAALKEAAERGRKVVTRQRYEIVNLLASGNQVAVEAIWTGTLAVPFGRASFPDRREALPDDRENPGVESLSPLDGPPRVLERLNAFVPSGSPVRVDTLRHQA
jgi:ketosteroid isomerase-like protein